MPHGRRHRGARDLCVAGHRGADRLRRLVGNVRDVDFRRHLDALHRKMGGGADARGGIRQLILARELQQLLQILRRHRRIHGDDVRRARPEDHRHEIGERVIAGVRIQRRVHGVSNAGDEQHVAVGRGALHLLGGDVAASAGLVLHDHRLAERLGELRRHQARDEVGGAARRKADHDVHRPRARPVLRQRRALRASSPDNKRKSRRFIGRCYHRAPVALNILFASKTEDASVWLPKLRQALPEDKFFVSPTEAIDVALVATPPAGTFEPLKRLKLVQSLWMGVERLLADPAFPKGVPLARLVDPGMVAAMSETVLAHVLDWHRHHYYYRAQQEARRWNRLKQYLASDRTIGLLGLGELGSDAARRLGALGFNLVGWSRRPKTLARRHLPHRARRRTREKRRGGVPAAADRPHARHPEFQDIQENPAGRRHHQRGPRRPPGRRGPDRRARLRPPGARLPRCLRARAAAARPPAVDPPGHHHHAARRRPHRAAHRDPARSSRTSSACAAASRRTTWWTSTPGIEFGVRVATRRRGTEFDSGSVTLFHLSFRLRLTPAAAWRDTKPYG